MNILLLTYQGGVAGSTHSIRYLAESLARKGHNVWVGCRQESILYEMVSKGPAHAVAMTFKGKLDRNNMRQIRDIVQQENIELINAQSSHDRYTCIFAKWLYKLPVKIVHTRRQISLSDGGKLQSLFYEKATDKIVAVSEGVKVSLVEKGISPDHVQVIYNGTPTEKYENIDPAQTIALKQKYNIKDDDFVIGCVSRRKKQEQILEALQMVKAPCKVIFVGIQEDDILRPLREAIQDRHTVIYAGEIPAEQVLPHYSLFSLKIMASTTEGLSQGMLEAMALGVPVIATNASGNNELIQDGVNGFLFEDGKSKELAEYIRQIREDTELRAKFSEAGKKTALQDFSIENTVNNYEQFFEALVKKAE